MDNSYIEDLRKQVKKALKEDKMRYRHTLGVADTSACLAMRYGVDMQKAYIAGLLHDCAKCVPDTVKLEECNRYGIEVTEFERIVCICSMQSSVHIMQRNCTISKIRPFAVQFTGTQRDMRA